MKDALALPINPMLKEALPDWQRRIDPSLLPGGLTRLHDPYHASMMGDWAAAATHWRQVGEPCREALALAEGDAAAVARALRILDCLGAARVRETVVAHARTRGVDIDAPARPHASTRASPAGLTPRQMQVLGHLGEGLSKAAIAERLFASAKTVDHHLSAILAKLDVASRGEAAARARDRGCFVRPSAPRGTAPGRRPRRLSDPTGP
jgi:DNA-binding CsgD family transcriptional regulator